MKRRDLKEKYMTTSAKKQSNTVERFGLEAVPDHLKTTSWYNYFFIQIAISINAGNVLVPALAVLEGGLSAPAAILSTVIGGLIAFFFVSLLSKPGATYGIPSQFAIRTFLGTKNARFFASPVRTITSLYWFAVQTLGGTYIIVELFHRAFGIKLPFFATAASLAVLIGLLALVGFHAIKKITTLLLPFLLLGGIIMLVLLITGLDGSNNLSIQFGEGSNNPLTMIFYASLAFVQYVSGVSSASDLARYAKSERQAFWGLLGGNGIGFLITAMLGAFSAALANDWNPFVTSSRLTDSVLLLTIIFLTAVISLININLSNAYTAGFSLLNTFPALGRIKSAVIIMIIGTALSMMPSLVDEAKSYISSLGAVIIPLSATIVTDFIISKHNNYTRLFVPLNKSAMYALIFGTLLYLLIPESLSPGFITFIVTSLAYFTFRKASKSVVNENM
jgi:purine-cytosine permease-like protein